MLKKTLRAGRKLLALVRRRDPFAPWPIVEDERDPTPMERGPVLDAFFSDDLARPDLVEIVELFTAVEIAGPPHAETLAWILSRSPELIQVAKEIDDLQRLDRRHCDCPEAGTRPPASGLFLVEIST